MAAILVAEFDRGFAEILCEYLRDDGHAVTVAHTDRMLVTLAGRQQTHLVVLDWSLQVLTGGLLCGRLQEGPRACPPILALTMGLMQRAAAEREECVKAIITMPVHRNELRHRVNVLLGTDSAAP